MNKSGIFVALGCLISGGAGGFIGFFITKKKYEKKITKEVEAVEAYYRKKNAKTEPVKKNDDNPTVVRPVDDGVCSTEEAQPIRKNYGAYFNNYGPTDTPEKFDPTKPYIITTEDYANSEYDTRSLYLYSDGTLTDEDNNVITDIIGVVGNEAVNTLLNSGESGDSIYVRNEKYKLDYEILKDNRCFKEVSPFRTSVVYPEDKD